MNLINTFFENISHRIDKNISISNESSSLFRMILSLYLFLFIDRDVIWLSYVPETLYNPLYLNISRVLGSFPPKYFLVFCTYLNLICMLCIGLGAKTRFFSRLYVLLFIITSSFTYSFGKIDHGILLPITILCLSFSNWSTLYALLPDKTSPYHIKSYHVLALCLVFGMASAGLGKLIVWLDFDLNTNGFLSWFYQRYFSINSRYLLADIVFHFPPILLEGFDYAGIIFELSAMFFLLKSKKSWLIWLISAITFHITNTLLLNIPFWANSILYFSFIIGHYKPNIKQIHVRVFHLIITSTFFILLYQKLFLSIKKSFLLFDKTTISTNTYLIMMLVLWTLLLIVSIKALFKKQKLT